MVSRHVSQFPYRLRCLSLHCLLQLKGVRIVAGTSRTPSSPFLSLSVLNPFKKESDIFSRPELCLLLFCSLAREKDTDFYQSLPFITICSFLFTQQTPSPPLQQSLTIFPDLHIHFRSQSYFCILKQSDILTNLIRLYLVILLVRLIDIPFHLLVFPNVRDNPFLEIGIANYLPAPNIPEFQRIGINRSLLSVKHCHNNSVICCSRRSGKLQTHTNFLIYSHIATTSDIFCIFAVSRHTKHLFLLHSQKIHLLTSSILFTI